MGLVLFRVHHIMAGPGIAVRDLFAWATSTSASSSSSGSHDVTSKPFSRALVSGPPASQDSSSFVTFICKPHSLDHNPPCLSQGVDPECDAFARITIKYIHDDEELRKYFAAFHVQRIFPRAVIIDDFYDLFNERSCAERFGHIRPRESAMVKTLALCYDAISFANGYGGRGAQCHLLVSDSHLWTTPRSVCRLAEMK
ncbi:hypothetical protein M758_6G211200 [Ceratodon purpureus]|uniref:Uncharacterized protein n=1 Tax=Ceratodon purpureus TaxID=3225 RepID=A0A8T0HKD1_CERPU|nr:hypothetical protein KC19_6G220900 [Ceratodon purpureus]KAG0614878.1 hypothetical protein M758_6G211200 [Ceratodon purpureus]